MSSRQSNYSKTYLVLHNRKFFNRVLLVILCVDGGDDGAVGTPADQVERLVALGQDELSAVNRMNLVC